MIRLICNNNPDDLVIASRTRLGGIRVGEGLKIDSETGLLTIEGGYKGAVPTGADLPMEGNNLLDVMVTMDNLRIWLWVGDEWLQIGGSRWCDPVPTEADLPIEDNSDGDVRITLDSLRTYIWFNNQWELAPADRKAMMICIKETLKSDTSGLVQVIIPQKLRFQTMLTQVNNTPQGGDIILDVNKNGVSIFTDQSKRPRIAQGATIGVVGVPDITDFDDGDLLSIDVDNTGISIPGGNDLMVTIKFN